MDQDFRLRSLALLSPLVLLFVSARAPAQQETLEATFKIEESSATPGDTVSLPLIISASGELQGFAISLDFDEEVLEATGVEDLYVRPDGGKWDFRSFVLNNSNDHPGNGGIDEGFIVGAGIFIFMEEPPAGILPPSGSDNQILGLNFRIKDSAPIGVTELRFLNGAHADPAYPGLDNNATLEMTSAGLTFEVTPTSINGRLGIVDDISIFVRGDTDGDGKVGLSDAVSMLGWLFQSGPAPHCLDAADSNDDGQLNVTDAIATLLSLFRGEGSLPPPSSAAGSDPTPDALDCASGV